MLLRSRLKELGVTPEFVRRHTLPPDTLFSPLRLSREAELSDEPPFVLLRETFCSPKVHVRYVTDLLLSSDYLDEDNPWCVMGAGETTAILYYAARPAGRVGRVLDLGCGAGSLGLLLASDADQVIVTDVNPRAIEFTRLNAAQNEIANVDARAGDLFEPVRGEKFDLIVSQPPYYPGVAGPVFLQGGPRGTEIADRLLREVPDYLSPEGRGYVLTSLPLELPTPRVDGLEIAEYTPGIGEVPATRHALLVLRPGAGSRRIDVDPGTWGDPAMLH